MKKLILTILLIVFVMIVASYVISNKNRVSNLVGPTPQKLQTPTPAPPQAPKTFQFDSSTDLEAELEKVNPQVLDSDFD